MALRQVGKNVQIVVKKRSYTKKAAWFAHRVALQNVANLPQKTYNDTHEIGLA